MVALNHSQGSSNDECQLLLDACTPHVYRQNAFRITGLLPDASIRDIKRRIDDLKHADEMGDAEEEHSHAFALHPPPTIDQIRDAALRLQDPERRIIEEFFWFWPMEWGNGKQDPALHALTQGDNKTPFRMWKKALSSDDPEETIVSKHNLAVMYQMAALDGELKSVKKSLTEDSLARIDEYWRTSFIWWEELSKAETFWSLISARIRMLNEPRLTTGFSRRLRATFPQAMDKINAMLAVQYIESGNAQLAQKHIAFMYETHQGLDNVSKTLALVTDPLRARICDAIDKAIHIADQSPTRAVRAAEDLFKAIHQPLSIIMEILPREDHDRIDLCDAVAEAALDCSNAFVREEHDPEQCLAILEEAQSIAGSQESRQKIADIIEIARGATLLQPILTACENALNAAQSRPENALSVANDLLAQVKEAQQQIEKPGISSEIRHRAKNEIAATLMQCAIIFGNKTEKWTPCVEYLQRSLSMAVDADLKKHINRNLQIAQHNSRVFDNLETISSVPSLSTTNGIGFTLYGSTDHDTVTGSYLSTYYFVFLAIPIFPICRYRVIPTGNGYRFLGKAPLRTFDKWHIFTVLALLASFIIIYALMENNTGSAVRSSSPSYTPSRNTTSAPPVRYTPPARSSLSIEINDGKARARQMEAQLDDLDNRLDQMDRQMKSYGLSGSTYDYNRLVPTFNALVNERNQLYGQYERLISDINTKVRQYNSGSR
jgi:hypothetical protein